MNRQAYIFLSIFLSLGISIAFTGCSAKTANSEHASPTYLAIGRGKIDIEGGLLYVTAPVDSQYETINAAVGSEVKVGDILATLNAEQEILATDMATAEVEHTQAEITSLSERLNYAESTAKRLSEAAGAGAVDQQQADEALQNTHQIKNEIAIAKAALNIAAVKLKQAQFALQKRTLRASQNAKIVKVLAQKGAQVTAAQNLAFILLPNKPFIVRAEINENFIDKIQPGSTASILFDSKPSATAKAKVIHVGSVLEASRWGDEQQPSRSIECTLEIEQQQNFKVGQNVMVKFNEQQ